MQLLHIIIREILLHISTRRNRLYAILLFFSFYFKSYGTLSGNDSKFKFIFSIITSVWKHVTCMIKCLEEISHFLIAKNNFIEMIKNVKCKKDI